MKKILIVAVATLCMLCSCTSSHKRAEQLIAEYEYKTDSVNNELDRMSVFFTPEEREYVEARAHVFQFETAARVADNWDLNSAELYQQAKNWAKHAQKIKVPLTDEQEAYCSKYAEMGMYNATVYVLKRWQEINEERHR